MAKLRPGIECPIIPEDFIATEEEALQLNQGHACRGTVPYYPDGIVMDDWIILERIIHQYPEA
jgi:hypothetical protein